jgi:hypothetical protein
MTNRNASSVWVAGAASAMYSHEATVVGTVLGTRLAAAMSTVLDAQVEAGLVEFPEEWVFFRGGESRRRSDRGVGSGQNVWQGCAQPGPFSLPVQVASCLLDILI